MAINDIYIMRLKGIYLGQELENVFNWKHITGEIATTALSWRSTFVDDIMPSLLAITNDQLTYHTIETVNWRDPSDFDIFDYDGVGLVDTTGDEPCASWLTNLFRFNRNNPGQHHGFKRFAGATESMFNGNGVGVSWGDEMAAVSAALAGGLTASFDRLARYFVVDRTGNPELGANPPGYVSTSVLYRGQGTQKSRKP